MTRRSANETRQLLLDTGVEMLFEMGISSPVGHVRLQNVLRRAGLTTGAAYRIWSGQEDFQRDLAEQAMLRRPDDRAPIASTEAAIRGVLEAGAPIEEVVRVATNAFIGSYAVGTGGGLSSDHFQTVLALRAAALGSERLRRAGLERHNQSIDSFMKLYATLARMYGLRIRRRYRLHDFAGVVAALGEGYAIQLIEGEQIPVVTVPDHDGIEREWTAYGRAVLACMGEFFEADPDPVE